MDLEKAAIERLKTASEMSLTYYEQPLIITYSGGKDSDISLELAGRSGIPYEVQHSHTTADAPQTFYYVRKKFYELELKGIKCTISPPRYKGQPTSMWDLIPRKLIPPTRAIRYCCDILKESNCKNRMIVTGARWSESNSRAANRGIYETLPSDIKKKLILSNDNDDARMLFENCRLKATRVCNPIIDWTDQNVWVYKRSENLSFNPLYDIGFDRVGCVGCPLAGNKRYKEFRIFRKYEQMYKAAFARCVEARKAAGKTNEGQWATPEGMWAWWMEDKNLDGQLSWEDL